MSEPTPGSPDPREVRAREAAEIVARETAFLAHRAEVLAREAEACADEPEAGL
jgi:hypothetical protein